MYVYSVFAVQYEHMYVFTVYSLWNACLYGFLPKYKDTYCTVYSVQALWSGPVQADWGPKKLSAAPYTELGALLKEEMETRIKTKTPGNIFKLNKLIKQINNKRVKYCWPYTIHHTYRASRDWGIDYLNQIKFLIKWFKRKIYLFTGKRPWIIFNTFSRILYELGILTWNPNATNYFAKTFSYLWMVI